MDKEIKLLDLDSIKMNPFQPRSDFDESSINELSESIKNHGIIQPIIVRFVNDQYQLISGERRLRAARLAGKNEIPAIVIDIDGLDVAEVSLIENIQRKNLNSIEEALAFNILKKQFGLSQEEIADKIGKSRPYVANCLRLLELPDEVKRLLIDGTLSAGHGRALLGLKPDTIAEITLQIVRDSLSVRQTEKLVKQITSPTNRPKKYKKQKLTDLTADASVYFEEVKKVIKDLRKSGAKADIIERESEDYFEILVRIPKENAII
ncbi:MAG TPA: ParB/RepB/Spo0J family partition protein [bacterium]|nr:ParB/RepB/Spo0J family partition protein [bacterium]